MRWDTVDLHEDAATVLEISPCWSSGNRTTLAWTTYALLTRSNEIGGKESNFCAHLVSAAIQHTSQQHYTG